MFKKFLIRNVFIVNEGKICKGDVLINNEIFEKITFNSPIFLDENEGQIIEAEGYYLFPGIIDTHVHFREPGLTHKGDIRFESMAAVAGGVTSFFDMPNTIPPTLSIENIEEKNKIASQTSLANYSFYIGATEQNWKEVLQIPLNEVCGIKIFLSSAPPSLLIKDFKVLNEIFSNSSHIIAVHCEDEKIITQNLLHYKEKYGNAIPISLHDKIRSVEACLSSSSLVVNLAKKYDTRLHLLHLSTEEELSLLSKQSSFKEKRISAEVCIHHLWFTNKDYDILGSKIKWNPSIKDVWHREALRRAITDDTIDIVSSDHAPHLLEEKQKTYEECPSGAPIIQFMLLMLVELSKKGILTLSQISQLLCHNPAMLFNIQKRGYIKEGYFADCVLVNLNKPFKVEKNNIYSKCKWSPLEDYIFSSTIEKTFVNGHLVYDNGSFDESIKGKKLTFERK